MRKWRDISTYPRELDVDTKAEWGRCALLSVPCTLHGARPFVGRLEADHWSPGVWEELLVAPTHWQPLPANPK